VARKAQMSFETETVDGPSPDRTETIGAKRQKSRIANGAFFTGDDIDHRSAWVRRAREVQSALIADLGGLSNTSESERLLARRVAVLEGELELMEGAFALAGQADPVALETYQRTANTQRRLCQALAIGLHRRARPIFEYPFERTGNANGSVRGELLDEDDET
jgi:hypothetical protein